MLFSEPIFLFLFLPLAVTFYYAIPSTWNSGRNAFLIAASLIFYAWGGGASVFFIAGAALVNSVFAAVIERQRARPSGRWWLATAITLDLLVLACCKYARFAVDNLNAILPPLGLSTIPVPQLVQPLGISFFTFVVVAYLVDVYSGRAAAIRNPIHAGLHTLFFSRMLAGPIVRPGDVAKELAKRTVSREQFAAAVRRFIIGLGKKVLIANTVADVADRIFAIPTAELRPAVAWLGVVCYTVQIYFDFCGYTDMAIGLGSMFGFRFPENFNYPYVATTVREFWRRWHMTLSSWLRDYLYIPLGGNRCSATRGYLNLAMVFLLCGLWHGARWTFVVWGLFQGVFLIIERLGWEKLQEKFWRPLRHVYLLLVLMASWVFFRSETLSQAAGYLAALTGLTKPTGVQDSVDAYLNSQLLLALVVGVLGSMPTIPALQRWLKTRADRMTQPGLAHGFNDAVVFAALAVVLVVSILVIAASTYSPFIYTQF